MVCCLGARQEIFTTIAQKMRSRARPASQILSLFFPLSFIRDSTQSRSGFLIMMINQ